MICLWKFLSDIKKQTHRFLGGASVLVVYLLRLPCDYIAVLSLIAACGGLNVWGAIHYRRKEHSQAIDLCSM